MLWLWPAIVPARTDGEYAAGSQRQEHGSWKTIALGRGEEMIFVWIEPLRLWVSRFEVTNGQYGRYDPDHDSGTYHGYRLNERHQPVVHVSWKDARNFCSWLTRHLADQIPPGYVFRLPSEQEWEKFAACGDERRFPWGDQWPPPDERNYRGEEGARGVFRLFVPRNYIRGHRGKFIVSSPVYQSGANEWGLYGAGGNVWEWCADWFDTNHTARVLRGASWANHQEHVLALTNRVAAPPEDKTAMIGFRVVIGKP